MTGPARTGPTRTGPTPTGPTERGQLNGPTPTGPTPTGPAVTDPSAGLAAPGARKRISLAPPGGWPHGARSVLAALGFAIYVGSIAGANWMISHVGARYREPMSCPVGFGLEAPSGVYLAGLTFVARDIVQRLAGLRVGVVAIVIGAALSWWLSSPAIAVASGVTFLLSESCDFLVYTPLQARHFPFAVVGSGLVADVVDSVVFLTLAGIPLAVALPASSWARPGWCCSEAWPPGPCAGTARSRTRRNLAAEDLRRVLHLPQAQAVGRGRRAGGRPVAGSQHRGELAGLAPPRTHFDQGADDRTDHLVAERRRLDLEAEPRAAQLGPPRPQHPAHQWAGPAPHRVAERGEIVLPEQRVAGRFHPADLQGPAHVPRRSGRERVGPLRAQQVVAVQAGEGAAPGVEARRAPRPPRGPRRWGPASC